MCIFCEKYKSGKGIVMENETCFAIRDEYPVNAGHMLVLPIEHKETYFDLTYKEHEDMVMLLKNCKTYLDKRLNPDGYNIGFNVGAWAGQTIMHCHAHIIPRYAGDVPATELRGGLRNFKKPLREYR
jgi:diadenosine tetraphosphate (Ap4A) HIT family hydrolase